MTTEGEWRHSEAIDTYELRLGKIFIATIKRRGGDSIYAKRWIATLNHDEVADTTDLEYAQGRVEYAIVCELTGLSAAYRRLKQRAPTAPDLFPDGAFERSKMLRLVKPMGAREDII
jgi:hypothetical protein